MEEKENTPNEEAQNDESPQKKAGLRLQQKNRKERQQRRKLIWSNIVVFVVLGLGALWIIKGYFHIGDRHYTEDAYVEQYINTINTRVEAYIKEIRFTAHQQVKKGDTLVILDDSELKAKSREAQAALQDAIAQKASIASSVKQVSSQIEVVSSHIAGAKAKLWNAEEELKRYKNLLDSEAVTRQQYDQIKTQYDAAKSSYESLVNQRKTSHLTTSETESKLEIAEAEIERAKAALSLAEINLSYSVITAPHDGVVGRRKMAAGQLMEPGSEVTTLVVARQKWVTANFLERQMPDIKEGSKFKMTADALGDEAFEGIVTHISGATGSQYSKIPTDNATGNFVKVQQRLPVRIEFTENNDSTQVNRLRAGMNMVLRLK